MTISFLWCILQLSCVCSSRHSKGGTLHTMNRRTFIGTSIGAAMMAGHTAWGAEGAHRIERVGLQLYTVRAAMKEDFEGTLAKVAQTGYREVEFAGYFD